MTDFSFKGFLYQVLIDPILSRLHDSVTLNIKPSEKVIDIACGTGALSISIAKKALHVTGIDLSDDIIGTAKRSARKRGLNNIKFYSRDASDLSTFKDKEFDTAVTSMAIHQFNEELAIKILLQMRRISSRIIIIDYNYPMPEGFSRSLAYKIERFAGGDHYRNFKVYMKNGGIKHFTDCSGLAIRSEMVRSNGVFRVSVCD